MIGPDKFKSGCCVQHLQHRASTAIQGPATVASLELLWITPPHPEIRPRTAAWKGPWNQECELGGFGGDTRFAPPNPAGLPIRADQKSQNSNTGRQSSD